MRLRPMVRIMAVQRLLTPTDEVRFLPGAPTLFDKLLIPIGVPTLMLIWFTFGLDAAGWTLAGLTVGFIYGYH